MSKRIMILHINTIILFVSLMMMPVSKLLCFPQKNMQHSLSTQGILMNKNIPLQLTSCHGCRKLFSLYVAAKDFQNEVFTNTEDTTLLGDINSENIDIVEGSHVRDAVSVSEKSEVLGGTKSVEYSSTEKSQSSHEPLSITSTIEPDQIQSNTVDMQNSSSLNFEDSGENSMYEMHPTKIREETSEITNEKDKRPTISSLQNYNLQENTETTIFTNLIRSTVWNSVNRNFSEKKSQKIGLSKNLRQVNKTGNETHENRLLSPTVLGIKSRQENLVTNVNGVVIENLETSENTESAAKPSTFVTNVNDVVIDENFEVSRTVDSSELPHVVTNVNGVVIKESSEVPKSLHLRATSITEETKVDEPETERTAKRLRTNKTLNLFEGDLAPECKKGDGACLKCREISPHCHYNFRTKSCFFSDATHGTLIYECGIRFFTADSYQPFFIALALLIVISFIVLFFLARAFYRHILQKDPITDMEVEDVRNVVHLIKDKRGV